MGLSTAEIQAPAAPFNGFLPIRPTLLLSRETSPCDLFRHLGRGEFILSVGRGMPFGSAEITRLRGLGIDQLYVREEDALVLFAAVKDSLAALVRNPAVSPEDKAKAVHAACHEALRRVFVDPRASFIEQAGEVLAPTVELILQDDQATRNLIRLTAHDHATYVHSTNVGIFSLALGRIFLGEDAIQGLRRAGAGFFLHDLGKCLIPLTILNKPGPLTDAERDLVNTHPQEGLRLLESSGLMTEDAGAILHQHHEKDDGSGYPLGLKGKDIHPFARICRLADVYEALTSERPYHQRHTTFQALKIMKDRVMADTDPALLQHFIRLFSL